MIRPLLSKFFLIFFLLICPPIQAANAVWILVDTAKLQLEVKQGNKTIAIMYNISIGQNGAGTKTQVGDDITPLGTYKIAWINNKSRFHRFYGFDYPSVKNARVALRSGLLTEAEYKQNITAHKNNIPPSQQTIIGGNIGIHGLGMADKRIHKLFNWTNGCIALTNQQIDRLSRWVGKGTMVKVK